jgi:hypothetical protein
MRFSVPSSCACKSRKFSVAFKSGYRSTTTSKRDKADESWPWAWSNAASLAGSLGAVLGSIFTCPTDARAAVISVSVDFSKLAAPETVATRLGMRSARR